jgi:UDP-glucose 4-epimerase
MNEVLTHRRTSPRTPNRVVIVGAGGFVGMAAAKRLLAAGARVAGLARQDVDLLAHDAMERLTAILRKDDTLVMIAAQAPVKNNAMLIDNLRMMAAVCGALASVPVEHVIYVSSDAVYADAGGLLCETSCAQPTSLHGVMHLARETMLANSYTGPLCILRPTLIYGAADPHNGYGPNRFRRLANRGEDIMLFGDGEERRDHVYIDDVAEIIARCVRHKSDGVLNIATGTATSFREIAERVAAISPKTSRIGTLPRTGPMPHGGYRGFDASATARAFPDIRYTPLESGLTLSQNQEFPDG